MKRWVCRGMALVAAVLLTAPLADAQPPAPAAGSQPGTEFGIRAPAGPPAPPTIRLEPAHPPEERSAPEQQFYPGYLIRSLHEPAFVEPFVTERPVSKTWAVRVGVSAWTAPAVPYDIREATGGAAFGLTIEWGIPVPGVTPPEPERGDRR